MNSDDAVPMEVDAPKPEAGKTKKSAKKSKSTNRAAQMEVDAPKPEEEGKTKKRAKKLRDLRRAKTISVDIQWRVIRNNSCFLRRQRGIPKSFSTEQFNPRHGNSLHLNGLLNRKCVDVKLSADKKAVVVSMKRRGAESKPIKSKHEVSLRKAKGLRRIRKALRGLSRHCKELDRRAAEKCVHRLLKTAKPPSTKGKWPHSKLKKDAKRQAAAANSTTVMDLD